MLIPLHVKSHYSLGHGTASVERLIERAAMVGLPALALTDRENLYGQVLFHRLARERNLHAITGVEIDGLVLLARDWEGYENLCRIITCRKLNMAPQHSPLQPSERASLSGLLGGRTGGLFVLADDPVTLEELIDCHILDRAYARFRLQRPSASSRRVTHEDALFAASRRLAVPMIADPNIDFLDPGDRTLHVLSTAIGQNLLVSQVEEQGLVAREGRHFPGPRECERLFGDVPEAVAETGQIAEACRLDLKRSKPIFPCVPLPAGETAYSHLAKLAFRGLEDRHKVISSTHLERLSQELHVIEKLGFCEYFIVVGGIVRFAREREIEVVGRGSGASSIIAHALGITNVDPIEHRLYFERFLHEGRSDLPDIDVDICWIRRDEVIQHVYRTYGDNRVAMISSHVTFQPHLAFREAIKAFGVPISEVNRLSRKIPYLHPEVDSKTPLHEIISTSPIAREIPLAEEPFRTAIPLAERLLNRPHHLSIHPGGIVIADRDIDAYVPLERAAKGFVITQYDMHSIEDFGLVKIDLLGNRCLTELQETLDHKRRDGVDLRLADIPDADPGALEVLQSAQTLGCFQLESPAMRSLLKKLQVRNIRDCIAAVAIIRPGAAAGGAKKSYIRRCRGDEEPSYLHPSLRRILEEAHGVIIYEEDVMCIANAIAGSSLAEGDALRAAIKKHRHPDDIRDVRNAFLRQSIQNGVEPDIAQAVWRDLTKFASYCFSKAHASGYGVLAYQSAYLKAHFPVEFGCALLNNHAGMYSIRTIAEEIKRRGVRILHPDVNRSEERFTVEQIQTSDTLSTRAVRIGLGRVKGLQLTSLEAILVARQSDGPFQSFSDFLRRVQFPRREVEALVLAGAFNNLPPPRCATEPLNHPQLLWELEISTKPSRSPDRTIDLNPSGWLDLGPSCMEYPALRPFSRLEQIQNELDVLELAVTDHPLHHLRNEARRRGYLTTEDAVKNTGKRVCIAGLVAASRSVRTRRGDTMQFLTIEDEHGLIEAILFPPAHRAYSAQVSTLGPFLFEGKVEDDQGAVSLNVSRIDRWDRPEKNPTP